jgi:hypothetical protein
VIPSSETEIRSRGRSALDRDGTSLEGVSSPRARRNPARRGDRPSSEAEPHPRGRPALERGEAFTRAAPAPSSEAEFRPKVSRPLVWWAVGPLVYLMRVVRFVRILFYEGKWVSPNCLGTLWLSFTLYSILTS